MGLNTPRAYVSKQRIRVPKELDIMEIGDAMCASGCCYGLTYLGSPKLDPLSFIRNDPSAALKTKTVRYSVAKLLRQKLPTILEGKSIRVDATGWNAFHAIVFCSFERTRSILSLSGEHDILKHIDPIRQARECAFVYLKQRLMNQSLWIEYTMEEREKYLKMEPRAFCSCVNKSLLEACDRICWKQREQMRNELPRVEMEEIPYYFWRKSFGANDDPKDCTDDWKGPWYKSTQTMDEDEMAFFNLDLRYIPALWKWIDRQRGDQPSERRQASSYSVVATLLLKLYVVNDMMHLLSPSKHGMIRLLLHMFCDQMLDLYTWIQCNTKAQMEHDKRCQLPRTEYWHRTDMKEAKKDSSEQGLVRDERILLSESERTFEAYGTEWKERVRRDPSTLVRPYDTVYPHGRRFVWAGDLPNLSHLFVLSDIWNKQRPVSTCMASVVIHVITSKTQPHRCQIRSLSTVIKENKDQYPSLIYMVLDIIWVHLMGMYAEAKHRPCWRSRSVLRAQFLEFATRPRKTIVKWIKENQHVVYNAIREHMYLQMKMVPPLRAILLKLAWQFENEVCCRHAAELTRSVISDRFAGGPGALGNLIVTQEEFQNARDVGGIDQQILDWFGIRPQYFLEDQDEYESIGFRTRPLYCPQSSRVRQMMYPHVLEGYRKQLHMQEYAEEDCDRLRDTLKNENLFDLLDMMNGEALVKGRYYQTKLRKGKFWERLQMEIIKYISGNCPYVLSLATWKRIVEATAKETKPDKRIKMKKKIEKSMIADISSYKSDAFSVMECDGIISGTHIRAIKNVAAQAAKDASGMINLYWLIPLGVSLGTVSYLLFLYYAYEYHDLPDNRLKNDVPYLANRKYQKKKKKKKKPSSKKQRTRRAGKGPEEEEEEEEEESEESESDDEEDEDTEESTSKKKESAETGSASVLGDVSPSDPDDFCYGFDIPFESWMDYHLVDYYPGEEEEEGASRPQEESKLWLRGMLDDREWKRVMKEYRKIVPGVSKERQEPFYLDDEEDYDDEDIDDEVEWRRERVLSEIGRAPTIGEMDIAIVCMFFHFYEHSKHFKIVPLTEKIATNQVRALRYKKNILPHVPTPKDIAVKRFCGCGVVFDPLVTGPQDITSIYSKGEFGGAYDLIRERKCCHKSSTQSTRFCDKSPMEVDMLGRAVRVGKSWYVICVICGSLTIWRRESYSELGPTCGCHPAPIRPPCKYPMTFVAQTTKEDMDLRNHFLDNGMLLNGWVQCTYCNEYIIPAKVVVIRVWDDTDTNGEDEEKKRLSNRRSSTRHRTCDCLTTHEEQEKVMKDWATEAFPEEEQHERTRRLWNVEKFGKTRKCQLTTICLCSEHLSHIGWSIKSHKIYSLKRLQRDLMTISKRKMNNRVSFRFAKAK